MSGGGEALVKIDEGGWALTFQCRCRAGLEIATVLLGSIEPRARVFLEKGASVPVI